MKATMLHGSYSCTGNACSRTPLIRACSASHFRSSLIRVPAAASHLRRGCYPRHHRHIHHAASGSQSSKSTDSQEQDPATQPQPADVAHTRAIDSAVQTPEASSTTSIEPSSTTSIEPGSTTSIEPSSTPHVQAGGTITPEPSITSREEESGTTNVEPSSTTNVNGFGTVEVGEGGTAIAFVTTSTTVTEEVIAEETVVEQRETSSGASDTTEQAVNKMFAWAYVPGTLFMFLSVLPPALFLVHRLLVTVLQITVFVICNVVFADHSIPPLMWRNVCQSCLETSSLLDELVPVLLLALAGLQQGLMDLCSGLFRILLLAPVLIPSAVVAISAVQSPGFREAADGWWAKVPQNVATKATSVGEKLKGFWSMVSSKVPSDWGEKAAEAWRALCTPAAQQLLLQGSILLMAGWLASVFTEPLRPTARNGSVSLILFILLRIATFVVDVAVLKELWGGLRTVMQGNGTLSHWLPSNQRVINIALARAACELMWAFAIAMRLMYGITTGWKVMVALYLLWFASSTWQMTQEQALTWPTGQWSTLAIHAVMALIVSWPLCLPGWEALPELGIIHRGSNGFWGSL